MFVYNSITDHSGGSSYSQKCLEKYFKHNKSWSGRVSTSSVLVILCALVLGGVSKVVSFIPLAACAATVGVLAWSLGEGASAEEPDWVNQLSLASTGLLYLGLGYCFGPVVLCFVPVALCLKRF